MACSEKANLEARLREGPVVVAYSGCTMRLLPQCRATGKYLWRRTTTSSDTVEIRDADELYAKLPLGAASLEGELTRSGRLAVTTTVSGQMQLAEFEPKSIAADGSCLGASHVVGALSVGAFKLKSGGGAQVRGAASAPGVGLAGGASAREESLMREAGSPDKCDLATETDIHVGCASPVQVFLRPLPRLIADQGMPGMVKVRFLPVRGDSDWHVASGERFRCTAPCEKWMDPAMPVNYRKERTVIDVPDLREHPVAPRMQVEAEPTKLARLVLGIIGTSIFGAAAATGTTLTAIGFGADKGDLKTAGLILLPIGLVGLAPSIWAIVTSSSNVKITPWETASDSANEPHH